MTGWTNPNLTPIVPLVQLGNLAAGAAIAVPGGEFLPIFEGSPGAVQIGSSLDWVINVSEFSSYDLNAYLYTTTGGAASGPLVGLVQLKWFDDLVSGIPVFDEDWWIWVGRAKTTVGNIQSGCGPMHGQYMSVTISPGVGVPSNQSVILQYINVFGSSRPQNWSDWRQNGQLVNPQAEGLTIIGSDNITGFDNQLAQASVVALSANESAWMPFALYSGPTYYWFNQSNTMLHDPVIVSCVNTVGGQLVPGTSSVGTLVDIPNATGGGTTQGIFNAPRGPCALIVQGNASGTSSFSLNVVGQQAA